MESYQPESKVQLKDKKYVLLKMCKNTYLDIQNKINSKIEGKFLFTIEEIENFEIKENFKLEKITNNHIFIQNNSKNKKNQIKRENNEKEYINMKNAQLIEIDKKLKKDDETLKKKNNINIKDNNIIRNYIKIMKYLLIIMISFNQILPNNELYLINSKLSNITLKIKGTGTKNVFTSHSNFNSIYYPNIIYINGEKQSIITYSYQLNQTDNIVELEWNNTIVESCYYMFFRCSDIYEMDLSNFDTSKVSSMGNMFNLCSLLTSLNLSNFNTSNVKTMGSMFRGCSLLTSLNLSNFDTSQVTNMGSMFYNCSNLSNLYISNFDTSQVTNMGSMFYNCLLLTSLNLSNFITSLVASMDNMFNGCINLEYINLKYFTENALENYENIYTQVPDNVVVCLNESNNILFSQLTNINCYAIDCSDEGEIEQKKKVNKTGLCLDLFDNDILYRYEYYGNYYEYCIKGELINNSTIKSCNYPSTIAMEISTTSELEIKSTYQEISREIASTFEFETMATDQEANQEIINLMENLIYFVENESLEKTKEIEYYNMILQNIETLFTSEKYNTSNLDNNKDEIITTKKIKITLTTSEIQKYSVNDNMTIILLRECETSLRKFYNLTNNETLYMKKLDISQEGMRIPKIEFDVYSKLSGKNLEKLNLSVCQEDEIYIFIPVIITENLDILNRSSGYYNDICSTAKSKSGTDIILKDRKNEYVEKTVCQDDCDFSDYSYTSQKARCTCKVKESSISFTDMDIDKKKLLDNFKNIKNIANLNLLVCYKSLFSKKGISKNIGSYIIIIIILIHIITMIIFYTKHFNLLKKKIKKIIYAIKNIELINDDNYRKNERIKKKEKNSGKKIKFNNNINNENKKISVRKSKIKNKTKKNTKDEEKSTYIKIYPKNIDKNVINNYTEKKRINNQLNKFPEENEKSKNKTIIEKIKKTMKYKDEEKNELSYDLALLHDKRTFFQYYISLLKARHNLFFSFWNNNDYNSKIIKIDLFFTGFTVYYAVNTLFYNDDTMHNIYIKKGSFDFEYQLPKIIYSSLISIIINKLLKFLALTNDNILQLKRNRQSHSINKKGKGLIKKISIKFIFYFIISFVLLIFIWYYVSMFCVIYCNTQFHLINDTLISYVLSLVYPFGIYLLPGFFRIPALSDPGMKKECLYKLSKILQLF